MFVVFALKRRADPIMLSAINVCPNIAKQQIPSVMKLLSQGTEMVGNFIAAAFFMYVDLISA